MGTTRAQVLPLKGEAVRRAGGGSDTPRIQPTSPSVRFADTSPARERT